MRSQLYANMHKALPRRRFLITDLGEFEGNHRLVHDINNRGQIVGCTLNPKTAGVEACLRLGDETRLLGTLGGSFSVARSINNQGEIVGGSLDQQDENFHAFLADDHELRDLNHFLPRNSGWELVQAIAINDHGQIIGIGSFHGEDHIFLLTPAASFASG